MPNLFKEACPPGALDPGVEFDLGAWFVDNGPHYAEPRARQVLTALKESGVTKVACVGYCYGARIGFNLAFDNVITVLAVSHPSLLKAPDDIEVRGFDCRSGSVRTKC